MEVIKARKPRKRIVRSLLINLTFTIVWIALLLYLAFISEKGASDTFQYVPPIIFLVNFTVRSIIDIITLKKHDKSLGR